MELVEITHLIPNSYNLREEVKSYMQGQSTKLTAGQFCQPSGDQNRTV